VEHEHLLATRTGAATVAPQHAELEAAALSGKVAIVMWSGGTSTSAPTPGRGRGESQLAGQGVAYITLAPLFYRPWPPLPTQCRSSRTGSTDWLFPQPKEGSATRPGAV